MSRLHSFLDEPTIHTRSRHGRITSLLLFSSGSWVTYSAVVLGSAEDTSRFTGLFAAIGIATLLIAICAWTNRGLGDDLCRLGLWFLFGMSLSVWLVGLFSIGWLLVPAIVLNVMALISWPRTAARPIATQEGILFQMLGFVSGPFFVVLMASGGG